MPEIIYLILIDFLKKSLYEGEWKWSDFEQYVVLIDIFGKLEQRQILSERKGTYLFISTNLTEIDL
ncbi:MAG TPA: hypothetical protein VEK32_20115 [Thermodesulfobacteriota bacterium]|nr:hypothetical protein [Thermodesulfobacteriota bacterium]